MQRRHEEQTETLIAIQQEITQIKPGADVTEMQRTIVTQRKDIKRLKDNNQALATDLEQARSSAKEARGELEREQRLRLEAEKKLSEYLDAQRKMAAQFSWRQTGRWIVARLHSSLGTNDTVNKLQLWYGVATVNLRKWTFALQTETSTKQLGINVSLHVYFKLYVYEYKANTYQNLSIKVWRTLAQYVSPAFLANVA